MLSSENCFIFLFSSSSSTIKGSPQVSLNLGHNLNKVVPLKRESEKKYAHKAHISEKFSSGEF